MNASLMLNSHQDSFQGTAADAAAPWAWTLATNEARTLHAESATRWLRVDSGSVWLTRSNGREQADDIWLVAGQSLALPAGSAWIVEAWPQARLSLLQQSPQAQEAAAASRRRGGWWLAASLRAPASLRAR